MIGLSFVAIVDEKEPTWLRTNRVIHSHQVIIDQTIRASEVYGENVSYLFTVRIYGSECTPWQGLKSSENRSVWP